MTERERPAMYQPRHRETTEPMQPYWNALTATPTRLARHRGDPDPTEGQPAPVDTSDPWQRVP